MLNKRVVIKILPVFFLSIPVVKIVSAMQRPVFSRMITSSTIE